MRNMLQEYGEEKRAGGPINYPFTVEQRDCLKPQYRSFSMAAAVADHTFEDPAIKLIRALETCCKIW